MKNWKLIEDSLSEEQKKYLRVQKFNYTGLGFAIGASFIGTLSLILFLKKKS